MLSLLGPLLLYQQVAPCLLLLLLLLVVLAGPGAAEPPSTEGIAADSRGEQAHTDVSGGPPTPPTAPTHTATHHFHVALNLHLHATMHAHLLAPLSPQGKQATHHVRQKCCRLLLRRGRHGLKLLGCQGGRATRSKLAHPPVQC